MTYEYLSSARILLFIPADHPILWGRDLSGNSIDNILTLPPEVLNGQDFVLLHPTDGFGFTVAGMMKTSGIHPANVLYAPSIVACYRMAASGMGITFATPYATRYTLPGLVPAIAELSTQAAYEHNAIAYSRKKKLSAIEQRFIAIAKDKICNAPLLQPLCQVALTGKHPRRWSGIFQISWLPHGTERAATILSHGQKGYNPYAESVFDIEGNILILSPQGGMLKCRFS